MRFFDLSQPLYDGCPNCPLDPPVKASIATDHPADGWRVELLSMASHSGTHLDAPLHKLAGGQSIDTYPLEQFAGRPLVADFTDSAPDRAISATDLEIRLPRDLEGLVVLLNTGWGRRRDQSDEWLYHSPFLLPDGAEWLAQHRPKGIGIDHYSIGGCREPENARTHEILLAAGIWIAEDLRFGDGWRSIVAAGATFQALPLYLRGFSGGPCRAVLIY